MPFLQVLNIYTCEPNGGVLGWISAFPDELPESDANHGVFLLHSTLPGGAAVPYDVGDTAVHEVGEGSINHCSLHCRLAKLRGLMIRVKYGAVIGRETRFFCMCPVTISRLLVLFSQSQRRV